MQHLTKIPSKYSNFTCLKSFNLFHSIHLQCAGSPHASNAGTEDWGRVNRRRPPAQEEVVGGGGAAEVFPARARVVPPAWRDAASLHGVPAHLPAGLQPQEGGHREEAAPSAGVTVSSYPCLIIFYSCSFHLFVHVCSSFYLVLLFICLYMFDHLFILFFSSSVCTCLFIFSSCSFHLFLHVCSSFPPVLLFICLRLLIFSSCSSLHLFVHVWSSFPPVLLFICLYMFDHLFLLFFSSSVCTCLIIFSSCSSLHLFVHVWSSFYLVLLFICVYMFLSCFYLVLLFICLYMFLSCFYLVLLFICLYMFAQLFILFFCLNIFTHHFILFFSWFFCTCIHFTIIFGVYLVLIIY